MSHRDVKVGAGPDLALWVPQALRYVGAPPKMKNFIIVGESRYFIHRLFKPISTHT